jgi:hypothetical protein
MTLPPRSQKRPIRRKELGPASARTDWSCQGVEVSHRFIMAMGVVGTCSLCNTGISSAVAAGLYEECLRADVGGDTVRTLGVMTKEDERFASGVFVTTKLGSCCLGSCVSLCVTAKEVGDLTPKASGDSGDCGNFGIGGACDFWDASETCDS